MTATVYPKRSRITADTRSAIEPASPPVVSTTLPLASTVRTDSSPDSLSASESSAIRIRTPPMFTPRSSATQRSVGSAMHPSSLSPYAASGSSRERRDRHGDGATADRDPRRRREHRRDPRQHGPEAEARVGRASSLGPTGRLRHPALGAGGARPVLPQRVER